MRAAWSQRQMAQTAQSGWPRGDGTLTWANPRHGPTIWGPSRCKGTGEGYTQTGDQGWAKFEEIRESFSEELRF